MNTQQSLVEQAAIQSPGGEAHASPPLAQAFSRWAMRVRLSSKLAFGLALAAFFSGVATYLALTPAGGTAGNPVTVRVLLLLNLVLLLLMMGVVAAEVVRLWAERRKGHAGSKLHIRIVTLFSVVAVTPAIVMAVFSGIFFHFGIQGWFGERVNTAISESVAVVEAYVAERRKVVQTDILNVAVMLNRDARDLLRSPELFNSVLSSLARSNGLSEAVVFDGSGRILARSSFSLAVAFERVPPEALEKAGKGQIALLNSEYEDRMRALVKLGGFLDSYLYVGKFVDPEVIDHLNKTYAAVAQYRQAEEQQTQIGVAFAALFTGVAMLVLLAAVWYGLNISNRLVRPISSMVTAAERVRQGDLSARVPEEEIDDEISTLNRTFNRMTGQLETQRRELIETNRQLDDRRRFTETVLAGVSAGVVGIDLDGRITLHNPSASSLLGISPDRMVGSQFAEVIPEMAELFKLAHGSERPAQGQVNLVRAGQMRNLMVRVSRETASEATLGFIVTFDDITDLVSAQRTAAWADVARRIAHEIKNPLTPIQLSAERLRRKYTHEIVTDPEVFNRCTDTIIRQVNDIGRMVDEFSSFARLPTPRFSDENAADLVRQALFLQQVAHSDIDFVSDLPAKNLILRCDSRQIAQALTNVLLNAAQSINGREGKSAGLPRGRIVIQGHASADGGVILEVMDNGRGLPSENRARLAEPYVTTRTKGTGLGLAIVKKIMEEHSGRLEMDDAPGGGAVVRLVFPDLHTLPLSENRPESGQPAKAAV